MVRYQCDSCGTLKEPGEAWILGFAAEAIGVTAARREISIASSWDENRAVDLLAVHFCSEECRLDYTQALFGNQTAAVTAETTVKRKVQRAMPDMVVETVVEETPVRKRRAAPRRKRR